METKCGRVSAAKGQCVAPGTPYCAAHTCSNHTCRFEKASDQHLCTQCLFELTSNQSGSDRAVGPGNEETAIVPLPPPYAAHEHRMVPLSDIFTKWWAIRVQCKHCGSNCTAGDYASRRPAPCSKHSSSQIDAAAGDARDSTTDPMSAPFVMVDGQMWTIHKDLKTGACIVEQGNMC
jgi:hypothetical protein